MAIYVYTDKPNHLLRSVREAIADGRIDRWQCDSDGDFTLSHERWNREAWLRPTVEPGQRIIFNIVSPRGKRISRLVYGVYHGRFAEMLLAYFDEKFDRVSLTAFASSGDQIG